MFYRTPLWLSTGLGGQANVFDRFLCFFVSKMFYRTPVLSCFALCVFYVFVFYIQHYYYAAILNKLVCVCDLHEIFREWSDHGTT